jgi:hypothetical protein
LAEEANHGVLHGKVTHYGSIQVLLLAFDAREKCPLVDQKEDGVLTVEVLHFRFGACYNWSLFPKLQYAVCVLGFAAL